MKKVVLTALAAAALVLIPLAKDNQLVVNAGTQTGNNSVQTQSGNNSTQSGNNSTQTGNNTIDKEEDNKSEAGNESVDNVVVTNENVASVDVDWAEVENQVESALQAGENQNVNVLVGKQFEVSASVLSKIAGKNVTLALQTGNGLAFSVSGKDVKNASAALNIDISQEVSIPEAASQKVLAGAVKSRVFGMKDKAVYPFTVNVHVGLGKENAGKMAYLYYYDEVSNSMKLTGSFRITENGQAMFALNHGDEYIVVVSDKVVAGTYTVASGDTISRIAAKNGVSIQSLLAINPQITDANKIYAGQKINIQ